MKRNNGSNIHQKKNLIINFMNGRKYFNVSVVGLFKISHTENLSLALEKRENIPFSFSVFIQGTKFLHW